MVHPALARSLAALLAAAGAALLLAAALGHEQPINELTSSRAGFDADLALRAHTLDELVQAAREKSPAPFDDLSASEKMEALYAVSAARFYAAHPYQTFTSNWILWMAGKLRRPLGVLHDPELVLRYSYGAVCSQHSAVLMALANHVGIKARHVALNGHVVMEAWYDDAWHMYDPTYSAIARTPGGRVLSVHEMIDEPRTIVDAYAPSRVDEVLPLYLSRDDNNFVSFPAGTQFHWKAELMTYIEAICETLKFALPTLMLIIGTWLVFKAGRRVGATEALPSR